MEKTPAWSSSAEVNSLFPSKPVPVRVRNGRENGSYASFKTLFLFVVVPVRRF